MVDHITIPGAIDLHVHLREPSTIEAETIKSGTKASLLGGHVLVCDMPNNPGSPTWTMERLLDKQRRITKSSFIPVATYAGSQPESDNLDELTAMAPLSIGLKLYGAPTTGNELDYEARDFEPIVKRWHAIAPQKPIVLHSGKDNFNAFIDLIARKYHHHLHLAHVNAASDVKLAARAKAVGLPVSCGVCPHHLLKTSYDVHSEGWFARMLPPLAHQDEAGELFRLFARGDIDVLETDHAPHLAKVKWEAETENSEGVRDTNHKACFGVPGVEFALPLLFYQMRRGRITLERIIDATSTKPAAIIGVKLNKNTAITWKMDEYRIGEQYPNGLSGSGWTPYLNNIAVGKVETVKIGGKTLVDHGKIIYKEPRVIANRGERV